MTPEEHIKRIERCVVEADLPGMADSIGELHSQWEALSAAMRSDILKLEAIFLTMLQARTRRS
jgi:hypothetical protein